jgi:hypothetical protein
MRRPSLQKPWEELDNKQTAGYFKDGELKTCRVNLDSNAVEREQLPQKCLLEGQLAGILCRTKDLDTLSSMLALPKGLPVASRF